LCRFRWSPYFGIHIVYAASYIISEGTIESDDTQKIIIKTYKTTEELNIKEYFNDLRDDGEDIEGILKEYN